MLQGNLLNRRAYLHVLFLRVVLQKRAVKTRPAHLGQLTPPLDAQSTLRRHHVPDLLVDAVPPELPLRWRRASTFRKAPLKKSISIVLSANRRFSWLTSLHSADSRAFAGGGLSPTLGRLELIAPPIQQPPMDPELSGELHDILALLEPIHGHLPERLRKLAHALFCHLPPPLL